MISTFLLINFFSSILLSAETVVEVSSAYTLNVILLSFKYNVRSLT